MESRKTSRDSSQTHPETSQEAKPEMSEPAGSSMQADPLAPAGVSVNPFAPDDGRYVTLEEYWVKWYENPYRDIDVSYEWNNGRLEACPPHTAPQLALCAWFLDLLRSYVSTLPIAKLIKLGVGFVLTMEDPVEPCGERKAVRKPDIGVLLKSNPAPWGGVDQRHVGGVCDMVVEAISDFTPEEVLRDTEEKKRDYALAGVKEYYILDPGGEHMCFYRLIAGGRYEEIEPDAEGVIGSEVLPGLQFRLEDLGRQRDIVELALDDVYFGYVLPGYRAAVAKAEAEARRADEATQRKEEEAAALQAAIAARQAAKRRYAAAVQRREKEAAARRESEERLRKMKAELARLRRQSS